MTPRCLRLFALAALGAAWVVAPLAAAGRADSPRLRLKVERFDPLVDGSALPDRLRHTREPESGFFVVQFDREIRPALLERARRRGVELLQYLPDNAYLARVTGAAQKAALREMSEVRWLGPIEPGWKIAPDIGERIYHDPGRRQAGRFYVSVDLFPRQDLEAVRAPIVATGATLLHTASFGSTRRLKVHATREQIEAIARVPAVAWIEELPELTSRNNTQTWVVQTDVQDVRSIWDQGLHGEAQIVGHIDDALDIDSCYLEDPIDNTPGPGHRKVVAYRSSTGLGSFAHGTHTAATLAGKQSSGSLDNAGNAYEARISHSNKADITGFGNTTSNVYATLALAHADGARVHSNSWGDDGQTGYTTMCRDIDLFSYDFEDSLVAFAATNQSTLRTPENAKNVLAVGASQNGFSNDTHCSGGTGPTDDGRRKPEIYAPGCSIVSASTATCGTTSMSGTSMACPAVSGAGALVRQYFEEGFYPSGTAQPADALGPSGALVKAVLLNATVDMTNISGYPTHLEGWGRLLLENGLYFAGDLRGLALLADVRNVQGLDTSEADNIPLVVTDSAEDLKVTLVFTEPPGSVMASTPTVNDLDLELVSPSGVVYLGNVFMGGVSIADGGLPDPINNVEQVLVPSPETGEWIARVGGTAVNQGPQGYALVASGQLDPLAGGSLRYLDHGIDDSGPFGNNDGALDPGETVTLPLTLLNLRSISATQVDAQLSASAQSPTRVTQGLADYPDIVAGGSGASLAPHYTMTLNPDAACGEVLTLDVDAAHSAGSNRSSFTVVVGTTDLAQTATDTPIAMPPFSVTPTESTITIGEDLTVGNIQVTVDVSHEDTSEVEISLTSPQSTTVLLHNLTPGVDVNTTFDSIREPDGPGVMDDFDGESTLGTWTLTVTDAVGGLPITPGGTLNGWSMSVEAGGGGICAPFGCGDAVPDEIGLYLVLTPQTGGDLSFDWPAVSGASSYRLWQSPGADFANEDVVATSGTASLVLPGARNEPDTRYYLVRAVNSCNWEGP